MKLLRVDTGGPADPLARERFVREGRAAASFSHPHAVTVYDAGDADGLLYLVMELVEGESLAQRLAQRGTLKIEEALGVGDQVLQALGAAHRAGIVHRDVKPANVLVTRAGVVKLTDFGIARRLDDLTGGLTSTGQVIGTPTYLAPEQAIGDRAGPASDLYSTGVVLYEMLTGAPPFVASSPLATAIAHRDTALPDVRKRRPEVPDHVAAALRRAMAKDPARRFASADDMRLALDPGSIRSGRQPASPAIAPTTRAPAVTAGTPTGHRGRRTWWWLALAAVAATAVIVIVAGGDGDTSPSTNVPEAAPTSSSATTAPAATHAAVPAPTTSDASPPPPTPRTSLAVTTSVPAAAPTLEGLLALIRSDPDRFGVHVDALERDLSRIVERVGSQRQRDIERLRNRLDDWNADATMTPATATLVRSVLDDLSPVDG